LPFDESSRDLYWLADDVSEPDFSPARVTPWRNTGQGLRLVTVVNWLISVFVPYYGCDKHPTACFSGADRSTPHSPSQQHITIFLVRVFTAKIPCAPLTSVQQSAQCY
jgi:hypothetical protein